MKLISETELLRNPEVTAKSVIEEQMTDLELIYPFHSTTEGEMLTKVLNACSVNHDGTVLDQCY